ncbi:MAG TPA: RDD family protein [Bryobacteraceae bacterium]|nr:RDD family protein [Bryobacteraceae bacterium]
MICTRCAHWNNEDDHRCTKCAARLSDRQVESAFHSLGALALQPVARESAAAVAEAESRPVLESESGPDSGNARVPRYVSSLQQSLFALREAGKIVSIDGSAAEVRPAKKNVATHNRRRLITASYLPQQGVLEFVPLAAPQARKLATSVDARIFCQHEVASVSHRMFAALYDLGYIGMMALAFLGLLYWGCDDLASALADPVSAAVLAASVVLIGLIYHSVFLAVRGETPGMRFAGLRLVDFDGRGTNAEQILMRIVGAFVSVLPACVGLLWALVDEESLTWQDHISHTFPTPVSND